MSRSPAKRFVDIEAAIRWAYRDELPKQHSGGTLIRTYGLLELGTGPIEDEGAVREPGYPAAAGEPHPDAIAIESAVKSLDGLRGHGFGADDVAGLTWGFEGFDVDYVQAGIEAVAMMAGIVTANARAGARPKWSRELPAPFPDHGSNGKPKVLVETIVENRGGISYSTAVPAPAARANQYRIGSYCPLVYRPAPTRVVAERAEWAAWRTGLEILFEALSGQLASIAVLPASAPWRPWAGEGEAHGRPPDLFRGLREQPYRRETREQASLRRRAAKRRAERDIRAEETRPIHRAQVATGIRGAKT